MNKILIRTAVLALSLAGGTATAQIEQVPHTFEAGTPARAAEVNQNFEASAVAINDNAMDTAALMERLDALEAQDISVFCDQGDSIQDAVDRANGPTTIFIDGVCDDGPYRIFGEHIELLGFGSTGATLSSLGSGDVLIVRGATVVLRNLTIDADGSNNGISMEGSSLDVVGVVVRDASQVGLRIDGSSYAAVTDSEVNNNGLGIVITGSSNAFLHRSTVQDNLISGVVVILNSSATVSFNTIINNNVGVVVTKMSSLALNNNLIENNVDKGVLIADQYGYLTTDGFVNTIQGNGTDVVCQARGIFESPVAQISNTSTTSLSSDCTVFGTIF